MWIGLIMSFLIGFFLMLLAYAFAYEDYYEKDPYEENEFRNKILKQPYDASEWYKTYKKEMSKEDKEKYEKYRKNFVIKQRIKSIFLYSIPVTIFVIIVFGASLLGGFLEKQSLNKQIASYQASKHTIEMSLENEDLTGFERVELVKQASEKNEWLAQKQYEVQQWYRFYLDKDAVLKLEPIDLTKSKGE